ncbi:MAG: hypothetical protein ACKVPX_09865 [Myxococcaceae bacterium]
MLSPLRRLLPLTSLLVATATWAGPREFVAPPPMSQEQEAALKARGNAALKSYLNQMPVDRPIPWLGIFLALGTLGAAAPFALRAYRDTIAGAPSKTGREE